MVVTGYPVHMTLMSRPYRLRSGLYPLVVALGLGGIFSCLWFSVSVWMMLQHSLDIFVWGVLIGVSTLTYASYMTFVARKLLAEAGRQYTLELTESEAILSIVDVRERKKSGQMVLLSDVRYAEYYPFPDSSCVILHAPYADMEIPLWPLGAQGQDAIDFLEGRGVKIINVQSDTRVPD